MFYFFISKMLGVDLSLRASTPTFIIEPIYYRTQKDRVGALFMVK